VDAARKGLGKEAIYSGRRGREKRSLKGILQSATTWHRQE